jgi:Probable cobalt transporter subunit (CbtB)
MAVPLTVANDTAVAPSIPAPVPLRELVPWAVFGAVVLLVLLYFVGVEQGALSLVGGHWMHEFVHDARHTLAFPCH